MRATEADGQNGMKTKDPDSEGAISERYLTEGRQHCKPHALPDKGVPVQSI